MSYIPTVNSGTVFHPLHSSSINNTMIPGFLSALIRSHKLTQGIGSKAWQISVNRTAHSLLNSQKSTFTKSHLKIKIWLTAEQSSLKPPWHLHLCHEVSPIQNIITERKTFYWISNSPTRIVQDVKKELLIVGAENCY